MSQKKQSFFDQLTEAGKIIVEEATNPVNWANAIIMGVQLKLANKLIDGVVNKGKTLLEGSPATPAAITSATDTAQTPSVKAVNS